MIESPHLRLRGVPLAPCQRRDRCSGLTLLELLLVLSLLVALAALTTPMLGRMFENRKLQSAAEQLRGDLVTTRVKAINTGSVFVLRHAPYAADYVIEPFQTPAAVGQGEPGTATSDVASPDIAPRDLVPRQRTLPEGIVFSGLEMLLDSRAVDSLSRITEGEERMLSEEGAESQMLFIYPDGTMTDAQLALSNTRDQVVTIGVRGLTGVVSVSEIRSAEELAP